MKASLTIRSIGVLPSLYVRGVPVTGGFTSAGLSYHCFCRCFYFYFQWVGLSSLKVSPLKVSLTICSISLFTFTLDVQLHLFAHFPTEGLTYHLFYWCFYLIPSTLLDVLGFPSWEFLPLKVSRTIVFLSVFTFTLSEPASRHWRFHPCRSPLPFVPFVFLPLL